MGKKKDNTNIITAILWWFGVLVGIPAAVFSALNLDAGGFLIFALLSVPCICISFNH